MTTILDQLQEWLSDADRSRPALASAGGARYPALLAGASGIGQPHAHSHPPNFAPPAIPTPLQLPSSPIVTPIPFSSCSSTVMIEGRPVARAGDIGIAMWCGGLFPLFEIPEGSSSVNIEGAPVARLMQDGTSHCQPGGTSPSDPPCNGSSDGILMSGGAVLTFIGGGSASAGEEASRSTCDTAGQAARLFTAAAAVSGAGSEGRAQTRGGKSDAQGDEHEDSARDTSSQTEPDRETWLEALLLDEDGEPLSDVEYEIELPDGERRTGRLDADGRVRIEGLTSRGTAVLRFPNLRAHDRLRTD